MPSEGELRQSIIAHIAAMTGTDSHAIDTSERFAELGLDSRRAEQLLQILNSELDTFLSSTLIWEHATVDALARRLAAPAAPAVTGTARLPGAPACEPVAVVGMSCRFPGASDVTSYRSLLNSGVCAVSDLPADRWGDVDVRSMQDRISHRGGFLERIDGFDPLFFGISPREAVEMDPQQRLMLELSWEALEEAGIPPAGLKSTRTGVFFGAMWSDYARLTGRASLTEHSATGQDLGIVATRVSYAFGLRGPSLVVNTACSSSLVAVHYARQSLLRGEAKLALAGGVNIIASLDSMVAMERFGAMSPNGRCATFDAAADGYVRGEGGGVVVLKLLSDAIADGDSVLAVLQGSAVNNDGFSNGMTAPSPQAQRMVLEDAYADADVDPHEVGYIEAHGTGTALGDPIEAEALGSVLGLGRDEATPLLVGSAKTNLGHLEAAAGIAGLIKTILAVRYGEIAPSLHFERPNPRIPFGTLRLAVPTTLRRWTGRRVAGVSSFGFGGTNCHVVVAGHGDQSELLTVGADTPAGLRTAVRKVRDDCRDPGDSRPLREICADAPDGHRRLCVVAEDREDLAERLDHLLASDIAGVAAAGEPSPVFVFAGQGSQWAAMGTELLDEPAFRSAFTRCDRAMAPYLEVSLMSKLLSKDELPTERTDWIQPAIFAVQVAVAALWRSWGVTPHAVIGQSMGEIAAAHVAGALSLEDAARVICLRSRLATRLAGQGVMALVELPADRIRPLLPDGGPTVAVTASQHTTVVSGDRVEVHELLEQLAQSGVSARQIDVDYASHSPLIVSILPELREMLAGVRPRKATTAFYSTVTGGELDGRELTGDYWCRNLREPVLFTETIQELVGSGHELFVDVNPHPIVTPAITECGGTVLPSLRRDQAGRRTVLESLCSLRESGARREQSEPEPVLVPLSAHTPAALTDVAEKLAAQVKQASESLSDLAFTAGTRRAHLRYRKAAIGRTGTELAEALLNLSPNEDEWSRTKVAFVFSGQGGQWHGMCRDFIANPGQSVAARAFHDTVTDCDAVIRDAAGFSVYELLNSDDMAWLDRTEYVQPVLFSISLGLDAALRAWGVQPSAVVGHSMGEVAAAYSAGALSLADAARIICARSAILGRIAGQGGMALVDLTESEAIDAIGVHARSVSIAAVNGARATVLTGDRNDLGMVLSELAERDVFTRWIKVDAAAHSPQLDPLLPGFSTDLSGINASSTEVPFWSTVTGARCDGQELTTEHWVRSLREPVRFADAVAGIAESGPVVFIELGPHPVLAGALTELPDVVAISSMRRDAGCATTLVEAIGELYESGFEVDFTRLWPDGGKVVSMPSYPWQHRRYWVTDPPDETEVSTDTKASRDVLAPSADKAERIEDYLVDRLARILGIPMEQVLRRRRLVELGLDSLMTMKLRNQIMHDLSVELPVNSLLRDRNIVELVADLLELVDGGAQRVDPAEILKSMERGSL